MHVLTVIMTAPALLPIDVELLHNAHRSLNFRYREIQADSLTPVIAVDRLDASTSLLQRVERARTFHPVRVTVLSPVQVVHFPYGQLSPSHVAHAP